VNVSAAKKRDRLRELLRSDEVRTAIIFCNRKTTVRELNKVLQRDGFRSSEIHGDMEQPQRLAELDRFKNGDVNILVASDVAARGLDIKGVSHVFNFDAPWHPDDYVHRIGRTGRAGATGIAYTFATSDDAENIANIEKLTGMTIARFEGGTAAAPGDEAASTEPTQARPPARRSRGGKKAVDKPAPEVSGDVQDREIAAAPRARPARDAAPRAAATERRPAPAPAPRRDQQDTDSNEDGGWNGPLPDFLKATIG
jgi:superfamily II DNA/RNA helicase